MAEKKPRTYTRKVPLNVAKGTKGFIRTKPAIPTPSPELYAAVRKAIETLQPVPAGPVLSEKGFLAGFRKMKRKLSKGSEARYNKVGLGIALAAWTTQGVMSDLTTTGGMREAGIGLAVSSALFSYADYKNKKKLSIERKNASEENRKVLSAVKDLILVEANKLISEGLDEKEVKIESTFEELLKEVTAEEHARGFQNMMD
jgi:hypothetical protein